MQCRVSWSVPASLLALMTLICLATCQEESDLLESLLEPHNIEIRSRRRLCGQRLTNALQLVCNSNYYSPQKRNSIGDGFMFTRGTDQEPPFLNSNAISMLRKRLFTLRGVADECCKKGCSFNELSSYCGDRR